LNYIRRAIYRWPAGRRNNISWGTWVRFLIERRIPQRFVRLERGVYPLNLVRPMEMAHDRRVVPHMPTGLGRALLEQRLVVNQ
jgi:hypothetical protein